MLIYFRISFDITLIQLHIFVSNSKHNTTSGELSQGSNIEFNRQSLRIKIREHKIVAHLI